jgi:serine/threonine protein kinase
MAEVFKAKLAGAAGTEKLVCIKRILPHLSKNQDFLSLFIKEAKVALPLTHGNITQVFDFGEEAGVYYLAMEYIAGQNLHEVLKRVRETGGLLDAGASLYIASEVCKGLQYAHSYVDGQGQKQEVVHRDVTPHNILISYNGEVKLTDFGIALAATKLGESSHDGVVRGKACYLSPEQADGHPGMPQSDVFSLGAVLYEMLTGLRLFEADTEAETLRRVRELEVEPPSRYNSALADSVDAVVMRALSRDPAKRFARAGEMQVELAQVLHSVHPDFTAATLAGALKDLFAWELSQLEQSGGASSDATRDRLLFQLSRAGVKVDTNASTSELLELGTVAIPGAKPPPPPPAVRRGRRILIAAVVGVLLGAAVVVAVRLRPGESARVDEEDEPALAFAAPEEIDHLTPSSTKTAPTPPAKTPDPKEVVRVKRKKAAAAGMGFINMNSWPWSVVYLDGRRLPNNTPIFGFKVPAGRHRLRFVNPELGLAKEAEVTVEAGEVKTVAVSLQQ